MLIDKYLQIEDKYGLYETKLNGMNIWMFVRVKIFTDYVTNQIYNLGPGPKLDRNLRAKVKMFPKYIYNSLHSFLKVKGKKVDLLLVCHPRRIKNSSGLFECIYTDRITERFKNYLSIEEPFHDFHLIPAKTENLLYIDFFELRSYIGYKIKKKIFNKWHKKIYEKAMNIVSNPIDDISEAYNVSISKEEIAELCCYFAYKASYFEREYEKILKRTQPKIIIETVSYSLSNMALNTAAHRNGLKVIELQHGHISSEHEGYHFSVVHDRKIETLPDEFYIFSDYYRNMIKMPNVKLVTIGYPFFEDNLNKYKERIDSSISHNNILFISYNYIGKRMASIAIELSKEIENNNLDWNIIFKLHPSECDGWEELYPELKGIDKIHVAGDHNTSIYDYLAISKYAVGLNSTAIYEALGFGVNLIIYDDNWREYIVDGLELVKYGYAQLATSPSEILEIIKLNTQALNQKDNSEFWPKAANSKLFTSIEENLK